MEKTYRKGVSWGNKTLHYFIKHMEYRPTTSLVSSKCDTFFVRVNNMAEFKATADILIKAIDAKWRTESDDSSLRTYVPDDQISIAEKQLTQDGSILISSYISPSFNGVWKTSVITLKEYKDVTFDSFRILPTIEFKYIRKWLSPLYTMPNGSLTDNKDKYEAEMLEFLKARFKYFLNEHGIRKVFKEYLCNRQLNGYCEYYRESALDDYLNTKDLNPIVDSSFIGSAVIYQPFSWGRTKEGFEYWRKISALWSHHVDMILLGIKQIPNNMEKV